MAITGLGNFGLNLQQGFQGFTSDAFVKYLAAAKAAKEAQASQPPPVSTPAEPTAMDQLKSFLAAGNIDAAVMLLQTERIKTLDETLGLGMQRLQNRNDQVRAANQELANAQKKLGQGNDEQKANAQAEVTRIKGKIDGLNADNQLDMIGIQDLVSKRQQGHEILTNTLGKLSKTTDSIIGNLR